MAPQSDNSRLLGELQQLVQTNGMLRSDARSADIAVDDGTFAADLVFSEPNGFQLWLGSLEDALSLEGLKKRGFNAFLNCALEECERECAVFKAPTRGRGRCHARGSSLGGCAAQGGDPEKTAGGTASLAPEQIKSLAVFDEDWYSNVLESDVAYHGIPASDVDGYPMDEHFAEAAAFLATCREQGRTVLIHCIMGINRSSTALVAFLCSSLGMSLRAAVNITSLHRGEILSNTSFLDQLIESYGGPSDCAPRPRAGSPVKSPPLSRAMASIREVESTGNLSALGGIADEPDSLKIQQPMNVHELNENGMVLLGR